MTVRKKKNLWKDASILTRAGLIVTLSIGLFTLSGLITGKLQKWIVEPVTEPITKRQERDSISRYWQRQKNSDTTRMIYEELHKIKSRIKLAE